MGREKVIWHNAILVSETSQPFGLGLLRTQAIVEPKVWPHRRRTLSFLRPADDWRWTRTYPGDQVMIGMDRNGHVVSIETVSATDEDHHQVVPVVYDPTSPGWS